MILLRWLVVAFETAVSSSAIQESEERLEGVIVGCLQSRDVLTPDISRLVQIATAPSKTRMSASIQKHVGHQARVATIAIRKGMSVGQPGVEAGCRFACLEHLLLQPVPRVFTKVLHFLRDLLPRDPDVLVA